MANIFLTRKCNLKCPYCFADEFVNKANEEITTENFIRALDFIKTSPQERVGLIGGEPTLHPEFKTFLELLNSDNDVKIYTIYTNGLEIDKYIDYFIKDKTGMLVNCNPPKDLGDKNYNKLKRNLKLLKKNDKNFHMGINLYSDRMDYSYIFDLLKMVGHRALRFSTALPNSAKEQVSNPLESYRKFKPFLFKFFNDCLKNDVIPTNDCNSIPNCLLTVEEKRLLLKLDIIAKQNREEKVGGVIDTAFTCMPVIDIMPNLQAVRCFGLSNVLKVPIDNFRNLESLKKYFYNKIDVYAKLSFENQECEDCKSRLLNKCGLCYTYKMKKCEKIKEYIMSM